MGHAAILRQGMVDAIAREGLRKAEPELRQNCWWLGQGRLEDFNWHANDEFLEQLVPA